MLDALRREFDLQLFADDGDASKTPGGEDASKASSSGDPGGEGDSGKGQTSQELKALEEQLKALRRENAEHRTKNKELSERLEKLGKLEEGLKKALGIEPEKADDAMKAVEDLRRELQNEKLQNTFSKAAMNAGADVELAWAFLKGSDKLTLDMSQKDVEKVLKETLEAYPKLKAEEPARKSGGSFTQPKDSSGKIDMNAAIRRMARR